jgi:hypothetical protein
MLDWYIYLFRLSVCCGFYVYICRVLSSSSGVCVCVCRCAAAVAAVPCSVCVCVCVLCVCASAPAWPVFLHVKGHSRSETASGRVRLFSFGDQLLATAEIHPTPPPRSPPFFFKPYTIGPGRKHYQVQSKSNSLNSAEIDFWFDVGGELFSAFLVVRKKKKKKK